MPQQSPRQLPVVVRLKLSKLRGIQVPVTSDPSKKLSFEPNQLPVQRLSAATHTSPPMVFKVKLVPRTTIGPITGPLDGKKRKLADAVLTDGPASTVLRALRTRQRSALTRTISKRSQ
jgi:hypothetical protein